MKLFSAKKMSVLPGLFVCMLLYVLCLSPAQAEETTGDAAPTEPGGVALQSECYIVDRPISWSPRREELAREYALTHYGSGQTEIVPQAVVVHWTASGDGDAVYRYFNKEAMEEEGKETLQVSSQFLVDRDGTIFRLTPETRLHRHAIGYNWCAIGIENVGGEGGREDLTAEQLAANVRLIRYLHGKYPSIRYVFGHYQQDVARESGLYRELIPDYYAGKTDPGPIFMGRLSGELKEDGLIFFR